MSVTNLFRQQITIYGKSSYDAYGRASLGSGTNVRSRIQPKQARKLMPNGDVLTIDAVTYVPPGTDVDTDDKVTYGDFTYKVVGKYPTPDGTGTVSFVRLELVKCQM